MVALAFGGEPEATPIEPITPATVPAAAPEAPAAPKGAEVPTAPAPLPSEVATAPTSQLAPAPFSAFVSTAALPARLAAYVGTGPEPVRLTGVDPATIEVLAALSLTPHLLLERQLPAPDPRRCTLVVAPFTGDWLLSADGACFLAGTRADAPPPREAIPPETGAPPWLATEALAPGGGTPLVLREDPSARHGYYVERDGRRLDTVEFATIFGDTITETRLARARNGVPTLRIALVVAGATAAITGGLAVATAPAVPELRVRPEPADFEDYDTYISNYDDWAWRQKQADVRDEQVTAGFALIGLGGILGVTVPLVGRDVHAHLRDPGWEYTPEEAAAHIADYNATLQVTPTSATITVVLP